MYVLPAFLIIQRFLHINIFLFTYNYSITFYMFSISKRVNIVNQFICIYQTGSLLYTQVLSPASIDLDLTQSWF